MNEAEAQNRAALAAIPLAVAIVGIVGTGLGLGIEATGVTSRLVEAHTVAEAVQVVTNSVSAVTIFGGLRMILDHGRDAAYILATGVGTTIAAGLGMIAGAKKS